MRWTRVLVGITVAMLSAGCSTPPPSGPPPSRLDEVIHRGELRICSTGDYRPLTYRDETGRWSGIDIDIARDMAAKLGVKATIVPTTWKTLTDDFTTRCDIAVGGISITTDRAKKAFFSSSFGVDGKTAIVRCADLGRFQTLEQIDQPGVRAVVNPGGTNEKFTRQQLHRATIVEHPDNNTIFQSIVDGSADVMLTDASETRWQAKQHPQLCPVHPDRPFTFAEKAYLLPRGDVIFQQWVDQYLNIVRNDGTYQRIASAWIG